MSDYRKRMIEQLNAELAVLRVRIVQLKRDRDISIALKAAMDAGFEPKVISMGTVEAQIQSSKVKLTHTRNMRDELDERRHNLKMEVND